MATATPLPAYRRPPASTANSFAHHLARLRPTACDWAYAREMVLPMTIGLIVLMLALAGNFVYWAINSIVNQGMSILPVLRLFFLAMPGFAVQGIPAGVILAVCLVLNRAVRDNEIIALRVGGASMPRIMTPFLLMSLLASGANYLVVEKVAPRTNNMAEKSLMKLMARSAIPLIEGDKYFRVGPYMFFVQSVENKVLKKVMIYDRGSGSFGALNDTTFPIVILADSAYEDPKVPNSWILKNVVVHNYDAQGYHKLESHADRHVINVGRELSTYWADQKQPFSMTGDELMQRINDLKDTPFDKNRLQADLVDYHRRFALPLACFVMALVAAPLALRFARQGSFAGLVLAFFLAFFWQGFDGWFRAMGIAGYLEPQVAAHLTNVMFTTVGLLLMWRER